MRHGPQSPGIYISGPACGPQSSGIYRSGPAYPVWELQSYNEGGGSAEVCRSESQKLRARPLSPEQDARLAAATALYLGEAVALILVCSRVHRDKLCGRCLLSCCLLASHQVQPKPTDMSVHEVPPLPGNARVVDAPEMPAAEA